MEAKKKNPGDDAALSMQEALVIMSSEDYEGLRDEQRVWARLQRPLCMAGVVMVWTAVVVAMMIMVDVVFAVSGDAFPFCEPRRLPSYHLVVAGARRVYTEEEAVDAFWLLVFLPSSIIFVFSAIYLFAGAPSSPFHLE